MFDAIVGVALCVTYWTVTTTLSLGYRAVRWTFSGPPPPTPEQLCAEIARLQDRIGTLEREVVHSTPGTCFTPAETGGAKNAGSVATPVDLN
jgi:hypothetical protein